ncbi:Reticulon-like protein 1 [Spathaspora sp. JA1]|nr:Reticulon-like protein 1 [Spathaspora sp. JA1]
MSSQAAACPISSGAPCELLTWKDPIKTGKVLVSIIAALVVFKTVNLLNLFFRISFIGLLVSAGVEYVSKVVTGKGLITTYKPSSSQSCAKKFNEEILPHLSSVTVHFEEQFRKIVYAQDIESTLKAAGVSFIAYKLSSWVSVFTLISIAVGLLFTVPFVYTTYKKEIDAFVADASKCAKQKSGEVFDEAHKTLAPHLETLRKKSGPLGDFIQAKLHTRTAGSTVKDTNDNVFGTNAAPAAESVGVATGSSKFPEVPTDKLNKSTVEDVIEQADEAFSETTQSF